MSCVGPFETELVVPHDVCNGELHYQRGVKSSGAVDQRSKMPLLVKGISCWRIKKGGGGREGEKIPSFGAQSPDWKVPGGICKFGAGAHVR
jgi:hypothetical protein